MTQSKENQSSPVRTKRVFKLIFVTLFVDLIAFTLILPLLPKILDYYATNDESGAYQLFDKNLKVLQKLLGVPESHNKVLLAGILGSWFSFLQFLSSPFLGALSDRVGRKIILLLAMSGSLVSYSIWYMSSGNFGLFVLSRTIGGLCKANVGLSLAIISDVSDESTRGKGMAIVGSSFSLAFITGPLFGAYLTTMAKGSSHESQLITSPSMIAMILSLIDLVLVMKFMEETKLPTGTRVSETVSQRSESIFSKAFHYINPRSIFNFKLLRESKGRQDDNKVLQSTGQIYFYYLLFYSGLEFTLSFLTHIRFGFSSMDQGKLYLFSGLLMAIIQGGYIRRIEGGREPLIALVGLALIIPSFIIMGLSTSVSQIYYSLILYSMSSSIVVPCLTTIVSTYCPVESKGVTMGTFRSIGALARALGPCLASLLFWTFGPMMCYIFGALALILPFYLMKNLCSRLNLSKKRIVEFKEPLAKAS